MYFGTIFQTVADLVFPRLCLGCDGVVESDSAKGPAEAFCPECLGKIQSEREKCCPRCGAESPRERFADGKCRLCRPHRLHFSRAVSIGNYRGLLQELVLQLKRERDEILALQFGRLLGRRFGQVFAAERIELLIPIPIHWWKRLRFGFHAAGVLAEGIAAECGYPVRENALKYSRLTVKQGTLDTPARFRNVAGAIAVAQAKAVAGKNILLVDDVMTSGATLSQAAKVLRSAGARRVVAVTAARGARVS